MKTRPSSCSSPDRAGADRLRLLALTFVVGAAAALPSQFASAQPPAAPPATTPPAPAAEEPDEADVADEPMAASGDDADPDKPAAEPDAAAAPAKPIVRDGRGRRVQKDEPTVLAFKSVGLDQILPFIVETTGKVVVPQRDVMQGRSITVVNDAPIPREEALELVIFALQQNGIGAVETDKYIILRAIEEIDRQDVPVIGPNESVLDRIDIGFIYSKVYPLHHSTAENIHEIVKSTLPPFAKDKSSFDAESNQIVVMGNIGLLQRVEHLVNALDQASSAALTSETFTLRFSDADAIANNIKELFSTTTGTGANRAGGGNNNNNPFARFFQGGGGNAGGGGRGGGGNTGRSGSSGNPEGSLSSANLRVTANRQQNSVTVLAERPVIEQVRMHITQDWDVPVRPEQAIPKTYQLVNTDAVKMRTLINNVLNGTTTSTGGGGERGGNQATTGQSQGAGRFAGQFSIDAMPESSRLVVLAKSPDNLQWLDKLIEELDQPQTAGLPRIIELKHASAEELADQLNALLALDSTAGTLRRQETGLSDNTATISPFAADAATAATGTTAATNAATNTITFWWARARQATDNSGVSNLVGKIRIVPVWRQNALMLLAPPEYQQSLTTLVEDLDKPGRQVLLAAVIAEVSLDDSTAVGLRWSNSTIIPSNQDNAISISSSSAGDTAGGVITGTKNDLLPGLFDTSVLNVGVDLNVLLQALNQKTKVNILSEPRIFTSDNQEATFFNGQDVPFVTDSQTTDNGTVNNTFDYKAVGINLRVRPRITVRRDVDLNISLQLSSITPNQTSNGSFIIDRRQTDTHLIVKDGQTVVLSGILRSEESDVKRKVPLLGDLPLIGTVFQSIEKTKRNSEVVAFITPIVIENDDEAFDANKKDRERLDQLRGIIRPEGEIKKALEESAEKKRQERGKGMDSGG